MACVYWIHLPKHTDFLTEGYIGYTAKTAEGRYGKHCERSKIPARRNTPLYRAMEKYGRENLVIITLCIGTPQYCLELENRLRPDHKIGWNLGIGGGHTTLGRKATEAERLHFSKVHSGRKWSEEKRKLMSEKFKGVKFRLGCKMPQAAKDRIGAAHRGMKRSKETKKKMSESMKRAWSSPELRAKISASKNGVKRPQKAKWRHQNADTQMWLKAIDIYDAYQNKQQKQFTPQQLEQLGYSPQKLFDLTKHFKRGWNPHTDPEYQEWKAKLAA